MEVTAEKTKVVVQLNQENVTYPAIPLEDPELLSSLSDVDTIEEVERDQVNEDSLSSCHSSEDEADIIEKDVSDVQIEEKDEDVRIVEGEDDESEEEEVEEEEEESDDDYTVSRTTIIPVECESTKEAIKMCCICNKVVDQHSPSEGEESGSSDKGKPLISGQNPYTEFPKCGCVSHFACLIHSRWVRTNNTRKTVMCPSCSEPKSKFSLEQTREHISGMKQYKPSVMVGIPDEVEKKKIAQSLIELLSHTGKIGEACQYATNMKNDYSDVWEYIKKGGCVKIDDFMKLGWDMSQVYHYVTTDFTELCNRYGFELDHLKHEQTAVGLALNYKVTATDLKTKFPDEFSLKKIAELQMSPISMMALGIDTHQLCLLGMKKDGIRRFKHLSMRDWVKMLNFSKEHLHILGIRKGDFINSKVLGNTYDSTESSFGYPRPPHSKSVASMSKRGEGVLWSVEGLRDLLDLTNEDLIKYKLVDPNEVKKGGKYYSPGSYYRGRPGRRKSLKQRKRQKNVLERQSAADGILEGIGPERKIIPISRNRHNNPRTRGGMRRQTARPGFAPLSDRQKRNIAQLQDIIKDVEK